jgi:predicted nucleic acid-binding protein
VIPRFVIADTTPISVLSLLGRNGLDLLLATGAELVVTDVVRDELLEEPDPGADVSAERRSEINDWIQQRVTEGRLTEMPTSAGRLYRAAMAGWQAIGSPPGVRPSRKDLGEASIVGLLSALTEEAGPQRTTFVIMDDRRGRAAVRALAVANIDLMGTAAYLRVLADDYNNKLAADAWGAIAAVVDTQLDHGIQADPLVFRR